MNILYTCDNNYVWIMGISMISLFENNKTIEDLNVYLLGDRISEENKEILQDIALRYSRKCFIIDTPKLNIPEVLCSKRWPISAFTRLFAGELLPKDLDKILYLDCDTIVNDNISEIWDVNVNKNVFFGVKDCISKTYKKNIGLEDDSIYVNAGVLLMNLKELRKIDVAKAIEDYLSKYTNYINYADQDILNGIFSETMGVLDPEYNVMTLLAEYEYKHILDLRFPTNYYSKEEIYLAVKEPKIIHYTTCMLSIRPWFSNSKHPYINEFNKYMNMSIWSNRELEVYKFNTKESRVLESISRLPRDMEVKLLGIIHAGLKPMYIRAMAKMKG